MLPTLIFPSSSHNTLNVTVLDAVSIFEIDFIVLLLHPFILLSFLPFLLLLLSLIVGRRERYEAQRMITNSLLIILLTTPFLLAEKNPIKCINGKSEVSCPGYCFTELDSNMRDLSNRCESVAECDTNKPCDWEGDKFVCCCNTDNCNKLPLTTMLSNMNRWTTANPTHPFARRPIRELVNPATAPLDLKPPAPSSDTPLPTQPTPPAAPAVPAAANSVPLVVPVQTTTTEEPTTTTSTTTAAPSTPAPVTTTAPAPTTTTRAPTTTTSTKAPETTTVLMLRAPEEPFEMPKKELATPKPTEAKKENVQSADVISSLPPWWVFALIGLAIGLLIIGAIAVCVRVRGIRKRSSDENSSLAHVEQAEPLCKPSSPQNPESPQNI
ncbi:hypothetical protein PRIPAC_96570 [Pristionchus pacificus]|uniref:Uncharacterized protein n=1 Tax=Pristionchus pacificus TaxID=54126 RepID=A0A2A6D170_PRIPA|nr:hypothetical protein PRIPAC_96570 [Pristionchus pacificus]|eukprot:PDM84031.1 hypothetical protein PRIPAC_34223 [Pristionchus pacificus]